SPDITKFACGYCGKEQVVHRAGGIVALKMIGDAVAKVQEGTDKTAAELALQRLERELNDCYTKRSTCEADRKRIKIGAGQSVQRGGVLLAFLVAVICLVLGSSFLVGIMIYLVAFLILWIYLGNQQKSQEAEVVEKLKSIDEQIVGLKEKIADKRQIVDS